MEPFDITIIRKGIRERVFRSVSEEIPVTIEVNGSELVTLLSSPGDLENLVYGFLFNSGFIGEVGDVKSLIIDRDRWKAAVKIAGEGIPEDMLFKRIYTSGCGKGVIFHNPLDVMNRARLPDGFTVDHKKIEEFMGMFQTKSSEHKETRGVHSSALADGNDILIFRDDIGRHNAIDKVIGETLCQGLVFEDKMILTSGRVSSEILSKILRCRIPIIVAAGAPTNQAVKLARNVNLTVVGLARGSIMCIFSGEERIV
ncbi:MAG: formate dehydrogenase accessory sulfurtransferase FdhD [Syntrophales bacterium]|jgi:FdhD protein